MSRVERFALKRHEMEADSKAILKAIGELKESVEQLLIYAIKGEVARLESSQEEKLFDEEVHRVIREVMNDIR